jgi:hypothetical protein
MNAPKFSPTFLVTVIAMSGSFAVFLMRYSERISNIERLNEEQQHRIEGRRDWSGDVSQLEKANSNLEWLVAGKAGRSLKLTLPPR